MFFLFFFFDCFFFHVIDASVSAWQATAMARASRPLFGDVTVAGGRRFRPARLVMRISQELAVVGEASGGWLEAVYASDSHCMTSDLLLLHTLLAVVVHVEERLRPGAGGRRASARAAF